MQAFRNYRRNGPKEPLCGMIKLYPESLEGLKRESEEIYKRCFDDGDKKPVACQVDENKIMLLQKRLPVRWSNRQVDSRKASVLKRSNSNRLLASLKTSSGHEDEVPIPGLWIYNTPRPSRDGAAFAIECNGTRRAAPAAQLAAPGGCLALPAPAAVAAPSSQQLPAPAAEAAPEAQSSPGPAAAAAPSVPASPEHAAAAAPSVPALLDRAADAAPRVPALPASAPPIEDAGAQQPGDGRENNSSSRQVFRCVVYWASVCRVWVPFGAEPPLGEGGEGKGGRDINR